MMSANRAAKKLGQRQGLLVRTVEEVNMCTRSRHAHDPDTFCHSQVIRQERE